MARVNATLAERLAGVLTAIATAVVMTAIAIVPFLTPAWVSFEQGRTGALQLTGFTPHELQYATNRVLGDLVLGGEFVIEMGSGSYLFNEREEAHMLDVQRVFGAFGLLAILAAVGLVALYIGARRLGHPERAWSAVRTGARVLAIGVVIAGAVAFFAFDVAFEIFHRLFFAGGSYTFDPGTDRLVQLFPFAFWSETTMAVGALIIALALVVATVAGRRARKHTAAPGIAATAGSRPHPEAAR